MNLYQLRISHLPYCIQEVEPGWHVVLNREYKPLGMLPFTGEWVDYHDYMVKFRGLGPAKAKRLSYKGSDDTKYIYLYNDGCVPTRDPVHETAYFKRVAILYKMKIDYDAVKPKSKSSGGAHLALDMNGYPPTSLGDNSATVKRWYTPDSLVSGLGRIASHFTRVGTSLGKFFLR